MGKSHYSGGHSIIRGDGSFSTYDPADPGRKPKPPKKNAAQEVKLAKKTSTQRKPISLAAQRKQVLNIAADAKASSSRKKLKFPKSIGDEVRNDVLRLGGIEDWAAKQVGFEELVKIKLHKKQRKAARKSEASGSYTFKSIVRRPLPGRQVDAGRNRIAFLRSEIAQAQKFIRAAEEEIRNLQGKKE